jgi:molybdenum cofactor cytidylyltransferase
MRSSHLGAERELIPSGLYMISAILLAAGESLRMGVFKQLLSLQDKTFVEHCADNLLASRVDEVIIVTGHRELEVRRAIADRPVRFAHNADYRSGMTSSIKCGVQALSENAQACILALVDQPQIGADLVDLVIDAYKSTHATIVIPTYGNHNGHPILLDACLNEEILKMDPDLGLRQVVRAHQDEIVRVEVSTHAVLEDCDFPDDYERMLRQ